MGRLILTFLVVLLSVWSMGAHAQGVSEFVLEDVRDVFDAEEYIATPSGIEIADDGQLYVSDPLNHRILVFSSGGELLHTIGRDGQGPGEFTQLGPMIVSGDSLRVLDPRSTRIQVFSKDGEYVRSYHVPGIGESGRFATFLPDGRLAAPTQGFRSSFLIRMVDVTGAAVDSIGALVADPIDIFNFAEMRAEADAGRIPEALRHWVDPIAGPDGSLWLLLHGDMLIRRYDSQGQLQLELELDVPEVEEMLERFFRATAAMEDNFVTSPSMAEAGRVVDDQLWLLLPRQREQPARFLVFAHDGTLLHRVSVPEGTGARDFAFSPDRSILYLAVRDQARLLAVDLPNGITD